MEIKCGKDGFLSLSIYESQIGFLISIILVVILACITGAQCIMKKPQTIAYNLETSKFLII